MTDSTQSGSDTNVTSKDTPTEVEAGKIKGVQAEQSAKIAHTTQAGLDHIVDVHEMVVDNSLDVIFDKMGYTKNTDFRKEAIRLITDWHNKQVKNAVATAEDDLDQYWNKELDKRIEAVLDRLESQSRRADDCTDDTIVVKMIWVVDERNKLKWDKEII